MTPKISPRTLGRLQRLSLPLRSVGIPLVVGVLVAVPVLAREAQSLPPYAAKAGEAATVVVRVVETRLRDSEVQAEFERTARYDTDVLSISADGMRVRWVLKDYGHAIKAVVRGRLANGLAALDTVNAALKGRIIEFDADPNGALLRVRDWDAQKAAIADAMRPALEAVLATAIKAQAATLSAEQIAAKAKERAIDLVSQTILVHTDVTAVAIFQDGALPALVQGVVAELAAHGLSAAPH